MKVFIGIDGVLKRVAKSIMRRESLQAGELGSLEALGRVVRALANRVTSLEDSSDVGFTEFEVTCGTSGATVALVHNYRTTVRWYVVDWRSTAVFPTLPSGHSLTRHTTTTDNELVLASYSAGVAVIRVCPAGTENS